jgi:hypothetical protein
MMIYIKVLSENNVVLGGTVATQAMLDDGWIEYEGVIPSIQEGQNFKLVKKKLVAYTPEIAPLTQVERYKEYLSSTDFKMLPGYVAKEGEDLESIKTQRDLAREYIRANDTTKRVSEPLPVPNTENSVI